MIQRNPKWVTSCQQGCYWGMQSFVKTRRSLFVSTSTLSCRPMYMV